MLANWKAPTYFPHDVWSSYEYLVHCQSEDFLCLLYGHVCLYSIMLTIEPGIIYYIMSTRTPISLKHMSFLLSIIGATWNNIPLKHRCPVKINSQTRFVYLRVEVPIANTLSTLVPYLIHTHYSVFYLDLQLSSEHNNIDIT